MRGNGRGEGGERVGGATGTGSEGEKREFTCSRWSERREAGREGRKGRVPITRMSASPSNMEW